MREWSKWIRKIENVQLGEESDVSQFGAANQEGADQALVIVRERNMVKDEPLSLYRWGGKIPPIKGSSL